MAKGTKGSSDQFAFARHSRESGKPASLAFNNMKSLDPRLRGDDSNPSDPATSTVVPRLRFPEFREAAAWEEATLGDVSEMRAGKFVAASDIADTPASGWFPCYGGNGLRGYTRSSTHEGKYSLIGRQGALCGNVRLFDGKFHATEHALVVTPGNGVDTDWLFYALGLLELNKYSIGQAQPGLSVQVLEKVPIATPRDSMEQQKIADCLTSLDEVLAAQGQKVEALKAHKRGLMQQLFPREGKTRPRLRFPEFRNAPEWERRTLKQLANDFLDGDWIESKDQSPSGIRLVQTGNVGVGEFLPKPANARYISEATFDRLNCTEIFPGDCLISRLPDPVGRACLVPNVAERMITAVDCTIVRLDSSQIVPSVFVSYSQTDQYSRTVESLSSGSTRTRISRATLGSLEISLPGLQEQQRIADCLSSLDAWITAESHQLAALKTHKQGLMQQLFPSPEAVAA